MRLGIGKVGLESESEILKRSPKHCAHWPKETRFGARASAQSPHSNGKRCIDKNKSFKFSGVALNAHI